MSNTFATYAAESNAIGIFRVATLNGALWAIGSGWASGVREITRILLPNEATTNAVLAELLAIVVITSIGVLVALIIGRCHCDKNRRRAGCDDAPSSTRSSSSHPRRPPILTSRDDPVTVSAALRQRRRHHPRRTQDEPDAPKPPPTPIPHPPARPSSSLASLPARRRAASLGVRGKTRDVRPIVHVRAR